jgi:lipopolysaccharide/colanic/teichoic acid biosynthesis glycosyltransferase
MTSIFYSRHAKRWLDVILSFVGLLFLSPLLLLVAAAVRLSSHGPAFFRQARTGQFEKPFHILKFRTMKTGAAGPLVTAAGDPRVTPLGRWLRKTKVDELPQLFNVLLGHMSLVGPRPEVPLYTAIYSQRQKQVFAARPGITCPFINIDEEELMAGRPDKEQFYISTVMPAKLEIDLAYCENIRFFHDLRLIFGTVAQLCSRLVRPPQPRSINSRQPQAPQAPQTTIEHRGPSELA